MHSQTTNGVMVQVESFYQQDYSNPLQGEYMFAYRITIENLNPYRVKLLMRHWDIFDSIGEHRHVEGEGVVGMQPELDEGQEYQYVSGCNLHSDMGKMWGNYIFENRVSRENFNVSIPTFQMIPFFKYN